MNEIKEGMNDVAPLVAVQSITGSHPPLLLSFPLRIVFFLRFLAKKKKKTGVTEHNGLAIQISTREANSGEDVRVMLHLPWFLHVYVHTLRLETISGRRLEREPLSSPFSFLSSPYARAS
jgi:hypothetical protein